LAATNKGICRVRLRLTGEAEFLDDLAANYPGLVPLKRTTEFRDLVRQFDRYFRGKLDRFQCRLDLGAGTPFQQGIWRRLGTIPYGQTRSYRWLAQAVGRPSAYRAAGNANGRNPIPILIPCHRVIRDNGELGGYTGGLDIKRFLLDLEHKTHGII